MPKEKVKAHSRTIENILSEAKRKDLINSIVERKPIDPETRYAFHLREIQKEFHKPIKERDWSSIKYHQKGLLFARLDAQRKTRKIRVQLLRKALKTMKT